MANDAEADGQEEAGKDGQPHRARIDLAGQHEFEHRIDHAQAIGHGQPARADGRTRIGCHHAEGRGEDAGDEEIDRQNEGSSAHGTTRKYPLRAW